MQDQPIAGPLNIPEVDEIEEAVLRTLLARHPALVALEELARDFSHPDPRWAVSAQFVEEAVDHLVQDGLAHRLERFALASYTAVRAQELGQ